MTRELAFDFVYIFFTHLSPSLLILAKNNKVGICILLLLVRRFAHAPQWVAEIFINWMDAI